MHCCRAGSAGLHNRVALQADPLRIHEWNSADGSNQPTAQAFWLLDRRRWTVARAMGDSASDLERKSQLDCTCGWRGHVGGHSCTEEQPACTRNINCSAGRHRNCWLIGLSYQCQLVGLGSASPRSACIHYPVDFLCRYRSGRDRRLGGRPRVVRRHECPFARLRRSNAHECQSKPRNGGARSRQPGRGIFSGLSHQQQLLTHSRGGSCRGSNAVNRSGRRAERCPAFVGRAEFYCKTCLLPR